MVRSFHALIGTGWGIAAVVGTPRGIARFVWPQPSVDQARRCVAAIAPESVEVPASRLPAGLAGKLAEYFAGRPVDFSAVPIDLSNLPPFYARVLAALRKIAYGRTISYAALAQRAGRARGRKAPLGAAPPARAVGQAMARNPIPVIVPCHRVLRSDGGLGGFSAEGGIELKRRLLAMEAESAPCRT